MTDDNKTPEPTEEFRKWIYRRFGMLGLIVILVFGFALTMYWQWNHIKKLPGVSYLVEISTRHSVPQADPQRFSIMVAHLENDEKREHERLIVEALKEFEGIQVLTLDRTIPLEGPVPEDMERQGQERAKGYLKESGASVLIWGMVLRLEGNTVYKLYWTPSPGVQGPPRRYVPSRADPQLQLPVVFWSDLSDILGMLIVLRIGDFQAKLGHYMTD